MGEPKLEPVHVLAAAAGPTSNRGGGQANIYNITAMYVFECCLGKRCSASFYVIMPVARQASFSVKMRAIKTRDNVMLT